MGREPERGQVTPLALGVMVIVLAVAGLSVDLTRAFLLRRTLQNAADSAALAGAGEVDEAHFRRSGGTRVRLDPDSARALAGSYLESRGLAPLARVDADPFAVEVQVRGTSPTGFLRLLGYGRLVVSASARSGARLGAVPD